MKDTKVIYALSSFDIYELNAFIKYINSAYFNSNEILSLLAELYVVEIKNETISDLSKEAAWQHAFHEEPYDDGKFRKINSELLKKVEDYIGQRNYEKDVFLPSLFKLKGIVGRELTKLYTVAGKANKRNIERNFLKSAEYFYARFKNEELTYKIQLQTERDRSRFKDLLSIDEASRDLDAFYLAEKLRLYAILLTWKRLYKVDKNIDYIDVLIKLSNQDRFSEVAPIQTYLTIIKMIKEPDVTEHFSNYKGNLKKYIHLFPQEEINEIYEAGFNFCVARVNVGDSSFQDETLLLYKEALQDNAIIKNGEITSASFNNIIIFALRVGEYEWAESFIEDYAPYLNQDIRSSTVAFSLARLEFYRKNYSKVIQHLINVEYSSVVITLSSKVILLFSYFELDEIDALDSLINSFRAFINREKSLSPKRKKSYSNLLNFTKKISRLNPNDQEKIKAIKQSLIETDNIASKPWLLEKIEELEK